MEQNDTVLESLILVLACWCAFDTLDRAGIQREAPIHDRRAEAGAGRRDHLLLQRVRHLHGHHPQRAELRYVLCCYVFNEEEDEEEEGARNVISWSFFKVFCIYKTSLSLVHTLIQLYSYVIA